MPLVPPAPLPTIASLTSLNQTTNEQQANINTWLDALAENHISSFTLIDELEEPKIEKTSNIPIKTLYKHYAPIKGISTKVRIYEEQTTLKCPHKFPTDDTLLGIEVEVENIKSPLPLTHYWSSKADGSLRNNGAEFVSNPLQAYQVPYAIEHLNTEMFKLNKPDFSNRTSTHIHLNCQDLTQDEIWVLVILYCIFEKHFYKVAGTKRLNSIFCVPVYRCNLLHRLDNLIYHQQTDTWSKYCGLNLLPLYPNGVTGTYGTIEFRHLYGTTDPEILYEWIDYILALRKLAKEISKDELIHLLKEMNTTSSYKHLYYRFIKDQKPLLTSNDEFESCISHVKRELFGNDYLKTLKPTTSSAFWVVDREQYILGK